MPSTAKAEDYLTARSGIPEFEIELADDLPVTFRNKYHF
jgi:hypothetical protein